MFHQVQTSHLESRFEKFFKLPVKLQAFKFMAISSQYKSPQLTIANPSDSTRRGLLVEAILPGGAAEAWNKQQDPGRGSEIGQGVEDQMTQKDVKFRGWKDQSWRIDWIQNGCFEDVLIFYFWWGSGRVKEFLGWTYCISSMTLTSAARPGHIDIKFSVSI